MYHISRTPFFRSAIYNTGRKLGKWWRLDWQPNFVGEEI
jgi:hypothetical protein